MFSFRNIFSHFLSNTIKRIMDRILEKDYVDNIRKEI